MLNLKETKPGRLYRVTWIIGDIANYLKERCGIREGSVIYILQNRKGGWVIFTLNDREYGLGPEAAYAVKVEKV